jgi:hypothetical protein
VTLVAVILATTLASALGCIVWLVYGRLRDAERHADARVAQVQVEADLERRAYELDVTQKALVAANRRAEALEDIIADEINAGSGLSPGDVRGRLLRLARGWRDAATARSPLPPAADEPVPEAEPADGAGPAFVPAVGAPDV